MRAFCALFFAGLLLATNVHASGPTYSTPHNWSGFYVGAIASYATGDGEHCDDLSCDLPATVYPNTDMDGWLGGITVGYNVQFSNWVVGIEGDWSWGDVDGSSPGTGSFNCLGLCSTEVSSIGTIRARLGYAMGNFLPFLSAGIAITRQEASLGSPVVVASGSDTSVTFAGGGGFEFAFTKNWIAKAEYLYVAAPDDFAYDPGAACGAPPGNCFTRNDHLNIFRIGLNYKF